MCGVELQEAMRLKGSVRLTARHRLTGEILKVIESPNLLVTSGKYLGAGLLIAETAYVVGLTYCAIGTGTTAPAVGQTTLTTEVGRASITNRTRVTNVATLSTFFPAAICTYAIEEVGIFGHTSATAAADSGELYARALLSYDNSGGTADLTLDWTVTVS